MQYGIFYSNSLKKQVKQIDKRAAKRLYDEGKTVIFKAAKMRFDSPWGNIFEIHPDKCEGKDFELVCAYFANYNCSAETGKYIQFFTTDF